MEYFISTNCNKTEQKKKYFFNSFFTSVKFNWSSIKKVNSDRISILTSPHADKVAQEQFHTTTHSAVLSIQITEHFQSIPDILLDCEKESFLPSSTNFTNNFLIFLTNLSAQASVRSKQKVEFYTKPCISL